MKRFIIIVLASFAMASCVVSDPYASNKLNQSNIGTYCSEVFEQDVHENVKCFYDAYYIAKFLEAGAEEQVSTKYDNIRTSLRWNSGNYSFGDMTVNLNKDDPFKVGGIWNVKLNYNRVITITMRSETEWKIEAEEDDTTILLTLHSADDAGMKMNIQVRGRWTEESSYNAEFKSEDIDVEIVNKTPIAIDKIYYGGTISFDFYEDLTRILVYDMTLRAGTTSIYTVY